MSTIKEMHVNSSYIWSLQNEPQNHRLCLTAPEAQTWLQYKIVCKNGNGNVTILMQHSVGTQKIFLYKPYMSAFGHSEINESHQYNKKPLVLK
jgi:hypothetical protein